MCIQYQNHLLKKMLLSIKVLDVKDSKVIRTKTEETIKTTGSKVRLLVC